MSEKIYSLRNPIRMVTASALFDGHDAAINIFRRIIQASGAEVIHLGHNRSVDEIVQTALAEHAQAIAVSSYQGGHLEFFKYIIDQLKLHKASHIKVFGGGGGVIIPKEIKELEQYGVERIYGPEHGQKLGLQGIVNDMLERSDFDPVITPLKAEQINSLKGIAKNLTCQTGPHPYQMLANHLTALENNQLDLSQLNLDIHKTAPVIGLTGTGGAGKSSLLDELIGRFTHYYPDKKIAVFCIDPSKRKTGGALLGDRIRMNSIYNPNVYLRSFATRSNSSPISKTIKDATQLAQTCEFDLIFLETSGIGQGDSQVVDVSDISLYVMTSEYGSPLQLEKIDMIDYANLIAVNKFEKPGSADAIREVRKQYRRSHQLFDPSISDDRLPIFGTIANQFHDSGVNALFIEITKLIEWKNDFINIKTNIESTTSPIIPSNRINYLSDISACIRKYHKHTADQKEHLVNRFSLKNSASLLPKIDLSQPLEQINSKIDQQADQLISGYNDLHEDLSQEEFAYTVRGKEFRIPLFEKSLSGNNIPKVSLPNFELDHEKYTFMRKEGFPGSFPYTAGVFPLKRQWEDPKRQFAGEGTPKRTNQRFHFLTQNDESKRLSTAFDSITLYGQDPTKRPDIFGKIGESGVNVCTLDDMNQLYAGFDLTAPKTSVSLTINGPAPMILAFFFNTAIDQMVEKASREKNRPLNPDEYQQIKAQTLSTVRGTVQADILKEDQAQNSCIFSLDFALRLMGDIQEYFVENKVNNFYSVSVSGYHIAEAGANPISQLAFTLANGFTLLEYYLARGIPVNQFAHNLSYFFSNGLDAEYSVIGRVARRIWAIALKKLYKANERCTKLKYHIQTSGRSLHAQEIDLNDVRTTLQALTAINDNCNSLHTNSFDEAITIPTKEAVRRAMAIQMIITKEFGLSKNENPLQGAYIMDYLTDLVEKLVLEEFDRLSSRGGVMGATELQYQRSKIQEESMHYEHLKNSGEYPIIGVNTFIDPDQENEDRDNINLSRSTNEEKMSQINNLELFKKKNHNQAEQAIERLKQAAINGQNVFAQLMETSRVASLGQMSQALYEVGGKYRRNI